MNEKEAIKKLKEVRRAFCGDDDDAREAIGEAMLALKYQEREEPKTNTLGRVNCPECGASVKFRRNWHMYNANYCPECGKGIRWGE